MRNNSRLGWRLLLPCLGLVLGAFTAQAQYEITWFAFGPAGSAGTGGVFAASGSIDPIGAGNLAGGSYTLEGSLLSVVGDVPLVNPPLLSLTHVNGSTIISWPLPSADFILEQAATFSGAPAWSRVDLPCQTNGARVCITLPTPAGNMFYRLRKP